MNRSTIGQFEKTISGKRAIVFFTWHNYTPANYRADFKAYKEYLEGYYNLDHDLLKKLSYSISAFPDEQKFLETIKQEIEYDLAKHPQELKDKEIISFEEFRKTTEKTVSDMIIDLFEKYPNLMPPGDLKQPIPTFSVDIDVESVQDRDWYFAHFFKKAKSLANMDKQSMTYKISGYWLLHNIVIPACHLPDESSHHEDAKTALLQQLKEHQEVLDKTLLDDTKLGRELKEYLTKYDNRNVRYLYMTVHGVWSAILSEFYSVYNAKHFIVIPPGSIQNYRVLVDKLTEVPQNQATDFYEEYLGYSNVGPTGEYSMGKIMGAIAIAAESESSIGKSGKPYDIFIDGKQMEAKKPEDRGKIIDDAITNGQNISLGNFDPTMVNMTLSKIRANKNLDGFVEYVEECFNALSISPKNHIFNKSIFSTLRKKANAPKFRLMTK